MPAAYACALANIRAVPGPVNDGEWHHVIAEVDRAAPEGIRIYVDGKPAGGKLSGSRLAPSASLANTADFVVGKCLFAGAIDFLALPAAPSPTPGPASKSSTRGSSTAPSCRFPRQGPHGKGATPAPSNRPPNPLWSGPPGRRCRRSRRQKSADNRGFGTCPL